MTAGDDGPLKWDLMMRVLLMHISTFFKKKGMSHTPSSCEGGSTQMRVSSMTVHSGSNHSRWEKFSNDIYSFIWLRWVFVAALRLSLAVANRGYSSLRRTGFSSRWFLLLQSTSSRCTGFISCSTWASVIATWGLNNVGSAVVAHWL